MKNRSSSSVQNTLEIWLRQVERETGKMLSVIQTNNAKEFLALEPWGLLRGIQLEFIEAYTPPQNGVAERFNRYILEITRALLFNSSVSRKYWKYAVVTANDLRNWTTIVKGSDNETPYELWHGHKPDLAHLRVWGSRVLYHHKSDDNLESRVMEGTFLLYEKSNKQYHVLQRGANEMRLVTNPTFRERERGYLTEAMDFDANSMLLTTRNHRRIQRLVLPCNMDDQTALKKQQTEPVMDDVCHDQRDTANSQPKEAKPTPQSSMPEVYDSFHRNPQARWMDCCNPPDLKRSISEPNHVGFRSLEAD